MRKIILMMSMLILMSSFASAALTDGLVSYWAFDEGSGTTAYDSAGSNDGGLVNGPVWTSGRLGGALDFDGGDDYVQTGNLQTSNINQLTISVWIKPSSLGNAVIVDKPLPSHSDPYYQYLFRISDEDTPGQLDIELTLNGNRNVWYTSNSVLNTGIWQHLVVTYDGIQKPKIYVNNQEKTTYQFIGGDTSGSITGYDTGLRIGKLTNVNTWPFSGLIDEVGIWNRALSSSEISQLYNSGSGYNPLSSYSVTGPTYSNFSSNPETTNFSALSDLTNVTMPVLATPHARIKWLGSGYNVSGKNFDQAVKLLHNFVSVDTSFLNEFNRSANITFKDVSYPNLGAYRIIKNGVTECTAPECVKLSASPVKFRVSHFSNYTTEGNSVPEFSHSKLLLVLFAGLICVFLFFRQKF